MWSHGLKQAIVTRLLSINQSLGLELSQTDRKKILSFDFLVAPVRSLQRQQKENNLYNNRNFTQRHSISFFNRLEMYFESKIQKIIYSLHQVDNKHFLPLFIFYYYIHIAKLEDFLLNNNVLIFHSSH